jgi:hypothetical protein
MQIAFTTGGDLFVMDTVLRDPKCVHGDTLTHERECVFAPDGSALYYLSDHGDGVALWKAERADKTKYLVGERRLRQDGPAGRRREPPQPEHQPGRHAPGLGRALREYRGSRHRRRGQDPLPQGLRRRRVRVVARRQVARRLAGRRLQQL